MGACVELLWEDEDYVVDRDIGGGLHVSSIGNDEIDRRETPLGRRRWLLCDCAGTILNNADQPGR